MPERASQLSAILKVSKAQQLMVIQRLAILRIYNNRSPIVEIPADNTSCVCICYEFMSCKRCSSYVAIRRETEKRIQNISHETLRKERDFLEHLSMNEKIVLKWILQKSSANCELDFSGSVLFNRRVNMIIILRVPLRQRIFRPAE